MVRKRSKQQIILLSLGATALLLLAVMFVYIGTFIYGQLPSRHPAVPVASANPQPIHADLDQSYTQTVQPLPPASSTSSTTTTNQAALSAQSANKNSSNSQGLAVGQKKQNAFSKFLSSVGL